MNDPHLPWTRSDKTGVFSKVTKSERITSTDLRDPKLITRFRPVIIGSVSMIGKISLCCFRRQNLAMMENETKINNSISSSTGAATYSKAAH